MPVMRQASPSFILHCMVFILGQRVGACACIVSKLIGAACRTTCNDLVSTSRTRRACVLCAANRTVLFRPNMWYVVTASVEVLKEARWN